MSDKVGGYQSSRLWATLSRRVEPVWNHFTWAHFLWNCSSDVHFSQSYREILSRGCRVCLFWLILALFIQVTQSMWIHSEIVLMLHHHESFTEYEMYPSMFLFKINDMLKTALTRLHCLWGLTLLIALWVRDEPQQGFLQSPCVWLNDLFILKVCLLTLCFGLFYCLCSVPGWTLKYTAVTVMVFVFKECCFTFLRLSFTLVLALMSASENGCFSTSSFFWQLCKCNSTRMSV